MLFLPTFLKDEIPQEHKDGMDMARDYLRRSHVLVVNDYLALDKELEVCKSRYGYIRVDYDEIRLTKGQRDITAEDLEILRGLRQRYLGCREEEMT